MLEYPLDIFDEAVRADPYPHYAELRAFGPAARNPLLFGMVMVTGHAEASTLLRDPERFSSAPTPLRLSQFDPFQAPTMLTSDPPDHTRLRALVSRAFTPRAIAVLEDRLRVRTAELLAPLRDGASIDVVEVLAATLPVIAIAELLGVPADDQGEFRAWSDELVAGALGLNDGERQTRAEHAVDDLRAYLGAQIAARRTAPSDDLIGRLVEANDDHQLDDAELLASCVLLLVAGNETTTNLIANMALALGRHDGERKRVADDESLVARAVEEAVRYDAPVQATIRTLTAPAVVAGEELQPDERVFVLLAAANRDPAVFADPDVFDVSRDASAHLGFGHGIHFCIGASLARLEARLGLAELYRAAPGWALEDDRPREYRGSFLFRRPSEVRIRP